MRAVIHPIVAHDDPALQCAMPVSGLMTVSSALASGKLVCDGFERDWGEVGELAHARAALLMEQGLSAEQVVLCPDVPAFDWVVMRRASGLCGAALFPYRAGLDACRWQALAEATGAEWSWCPMSQRLISTGLHSAAPWSGHSPLALLIQTSGSSGQPRIAMLTRETLRASALASNQRLGVGPETVWLGCLRLCHIGGAAIVERCALAAAGLVLEQGFDPAGVANALHRHAVTHVSLVPPMLDRLVSLGRPPPASLRVALIGGQALRPHLARKALDAGWPLYPTYGMTETASQIATATHPLAHAHDCGRAGPLLPGVQVEGGSPPRRLRVRAPMLMAGYANPGRVPGEGLDQGWFETADFAEICKDGALGQITRADDLLVIGGLQVSPARIEDCLQAAPGVDDLVLVALKDAAWGHRLVVLYRGDTSEADFAGWCARYLTGSERPRVFKRLAALPTLASGKPDRELARQWAGELVDGLSSDARSCKR